MWTYLSGTLPLPTVHLPTVHLLQRISSAELGQPLSSTEHQCHLFFQALYVQKAKTGASYVVVVASVETQQQRSTFQRMGNHWAETFYILTFMIKLPNCESEENEIKFTLARACPNGFGRDLVYLDKSFQALTAFQSMGWWRWSRQCALR